MFLWSKVSYHSPCHLEHPFSWKIPFHSKCLFHHWRTINETSPHWSKLGKLVVIFFGRTLHIWAWLLGHPEHSSILCHWHIALLVLLAYAVLLRAIISLKMCGGGQIGVFFLVAGKFGAICVWWRYRMAYFSWWQGKLAPYVNQTNDNF